jgi:hypothetical protein
VSFAEGKFLQVLILNRWIKNSKGQVFDPSLGNGLIKENKMLREDRQMQKKVVKFFAAQKP